MGSCNANGIRDYGNEGLRECDRLFFSEDFAVVGSCFFGDGFLAPGIEARHPLLDPSLPPRLGKRKFSFLRNIEGMNK